MSQSYDVKIYEGFLDIRYMMECINIKNGADSQIVFKLIL